jgi:hypothetical protein
LGLTVAKTLFSWANAIDRATFSAGSEAATLPVANLATPRTGRIWRALAATSWFSAALAAPTSLQILALGGCGLASGDQVRHRLYDAGGALLIDDTVAAGVLPGYGLHIHALAAPVTAASWRCDITATSRAASGYFDIKRAWAGPVFQPACGIVIPWDESWEDAAPISRNPRSGGVSPGDGARYRSMNVALDWISDSEKAQLKEMTRLIGTRSQLLLVPDQDGDMPREAILGRLAKISPIAASQDTAPPVYSQAFNILQDI